MKKVQNFFQDMQTYDHNKMQVQHYTMLNLTIQKSRENLNARTTTQAEIHFLKCRKPHFTS